jgi:hypothetical protein
VRSAACAEGLLKYSATAAATAAPIDPIAAIIAPIAAEVSGFTQGGTDTDGGGLCLARALALKRTHQSAITRRRLHVDIEQPLVLGWDTLSDRSVSCCVGSRATGDRKPNGWLQAVLALKEKYAACGDLPLLQRSVVQGVELVRGVVLPEFAAIRKKRSFAPATRSRVTNPECVPARRWSSSCGRPLPGVLSS